MSSIICPRCKVGIDDDGDGNCAACARWSDEEAARVRRVVEAKHRKARALVNSFPA